MPRGGIMMIPPICIALPKHKLSNGVVQINVVILLFWLVNPTIHKFTSTHSSKSSFAFII